MEYFPVLAYHKISPESEFGLTTISPRIFDEQIQIIIDEKFNPITFIQLASGMPLPPKPIIISFDDGYESLFRYALPILEKYNIKAVIYALAGYIGDMNNWEAFPVQRKSRHLDQNQLREMSDLDHEIGSHGMNHKYLPVLDRAELSSELSTSRQILQDITGRNVVSFCYPYGISTRVIQNELLRHDYSYAVGNLHLADDKTGINAVHIGRRSIYSVDSEHMFRQKLIRPKLNHITILSEKLIRLGAIPGILYKILTDN